MANISNWIHLNVIGYLLLLLVLNFIKELEGSNAHVPLTLQHHCHICRLIIQLYDLCKLHNKSCFISLNYNNGIMQKTHCAAIFSIANKDNIDGFFQHTLAALPHAHSINNCCLELDNVKRDNKHAAAIMLDPRSTISRGSKDKNFTITGWHHCCLIFYWVKVMKNAAVGASVPGVFWVPCARCEQRGDKKTGETQEWVIWQSGAWFKNHIHD